MDFDHSIDTITADVSTDPIRIGGTGGVKIPSGTTAERVVEDGVVRKNTTTNKIEVYNSTITTWIELDDILDLVSNVQSAASVDFNGTNTYNMTAEESKKSLVVITNTATSGTNNLYLYDAVDNPVQYCFVNCNSYEVLITCCSGTVTKTLPANRTADFIYGYGAGAADITYTASKHVFVDNSSSDITDMAYGDTVNLALWKLFNNMAIKKNNVNKPLAIDIGAANYNMTASESEHVMLVFLNVGTGSSIVRLKNGEDHQPAIYTIFVYDANGIYLNDETDTSSIFIEPLRAQQIAVANNGISLVAIKADTSTVEPSTDRNYVTDTEKAVLAGSLNAGVYIQETEPVSATAYIWYKTNSLGEVIDILKGP